jgi:EAL domain-containing protein (putative c-di-GMP-specific phosphodiesterase class I)/GGDEF domain-containing protein
MDDFNPLVDERVRMVEVDRLTADLESGSDPVLNSVVAMISAHFHVPTALVSLVDRDFQIFKAKVGLDVECTPREYSFCAHHLGELDVLEVCNTLLDARFSGNPLVTGAPFIRYYAGAALTVRPGLALGRLCILADKSRAPMSEQDKTLLKHAAALVVARLQSMHEQQFFDPGTGLSNRQRFEMDVHGDGGLQGERIAILIEPLPATGVDRLVKALGLDFFANFMLTVKEQLLALLPPGTRLYQASASSFAVLIKSNDAPLSPLLESITEMFNHPILSGSAPVFADLGMSVLPISSDKPMPVDSLRLMASITNDARQCEQRWLYYDPLIDSKLLRSTTVLNSIEAALVAPDQFRLVYQPRMHLASDRCVAVEALLRWTHPTLGEVGPDEFICLAETTASIRHITTWVVRHVCLQVAQWQAQGLLMKVSLNVSALDLTDGRLFDVLTQALGEYGVAPSYIELEFTESALVTDFDEVVKQLKRFRQLGVAIGIDDFGSGYSNWTYLRQLPATSLKLDKSLLADLSPGNSAWHIVRGLISLARDLNFTVVAEGVETELDYHLLRGWGCHEGQGYYFAKPMPPHELSGWLDRHEGRG